ncbi:MAG: DUF433 domain-containing protein [Gemmataceae bacterium]|nr:DUF433 domain-containing protein [Gemmataceae bacterium]
MTVVADPPPMTAGPDGVFRVGGTRVTLDTVVGAFLDGASAETIADQYPSLELADVYAAIAYYLRHRAEVNEYLARRREQAAATRQRVEADFPPEGVRARLLARRNQPS